jgi:hypothetical protein
LWNAKVVREEFVLPLFRLVGGWAIGMSILFFIPVSVVAITIYGLLTRYFHPRKNILRRYRRKKKGLCLTCGYNLTGNVSGICPECGEKI